MPKDLTSKSLSDANRKRRYDLKICKYPSELASEEIKHYLEIQINVRGKSKYNTENRLFQIDRPIDGANLSDDELAQSKSAATIIDGGLFGKSVGDKIAAILPKSGKKVSGYIGAVAGAVSGYAAGKTSEILKPDTKHRISDVINLYLAEPPSVKYTTNWVNKDLGSLFGVLGGTAFHNGIQEGASTAGSAIVMQTAKLPQIFGGVSARDVLSASTGTNLNPFKECIFESVDFRSFAFTYRFMPRSPEESQSVKEILDLMKFHMHPEMDASRLFFIYPAEFQLTYYFNGRENDSLFKFAPCILSELEVSYGEGQFSSFVDGYPGEIIAKMTFRETEVNTKETIKDGR